MRMYKQHLCLKICEMPLTVPPFLSFFFFIFSFLNMHACASATHNIIYFIYFFSYWTYFDRLGRWARRGADLLVCLKARSFPRINEGSALSYGDRCELRYVAWILPYRDRKLFFWNIAAQQSQDINEWLGFTYVVWKSGGGFIRRAEQVGAVYSNRFSPRLSD